MSQKVFALYKSPVRLVVIHPTHAGLRNWQGRYFLPVTAVLRPQGVPG